MRVVVIADCQRKCSGARSTASGMVLAIALAALSGAAVADADLLQSARAIEGYLQGFPQRAQAALADMLPQAASAPPAEQRFVNVLYGHSLVHSGRDGDALAFADQLQARATAALDDAGSATALLIRSGARSWAGDAAGANTLALAARSKAKGVRDPYLAYWAALAVGNTARLLGQNQEAASILREALAHADDAGNSNRRSAAHYQLAIAYVALNKPTQALAESNLAFEQGRLANNVYAMARGKIAASEAFGALNDPAAELTSLLESLAIGRSGGSRVTEALALVKLSDLRLRRREYAAAQEIAEQAVAALQEVDDFALLATAKANMGFALLATGRTEAGKDLVDAALADWERSQSTSGVTWLFGKYAQYLASAGDFKSALAMSEQERALALRYVADRHRHEVELLNRDNALQVAELQNQRLQQGIAWGVALVSAGFLLLVAILYRKLQTINRLVAERNRQLDEQSTHDPLTGLFNRRYFANLMESDAFREERRRSGEDRAVHALLLIDLDHFKQINDRHGHAAGDAVLVETARRLRSTLRESDVCVRWGGEEFLIFVPATTLDTLQELASRIMRTIGNDAIDFEHGALAVTASVGYVPVPLPPNGVMPPWIGAVGLADKACYMAKRDGRNRAVGIHGYHGTDAEGLAEVERDLPAAVQRGAVVIHTIFAPSGLAREALPLPDGISSRTA